MDPLLRQKSPRRTFLSDCGMGFTGLALSTMLFRDGISKANAESGAWAPPTGQPLFQPKAKSVIWIFLSGGYSHLETFDPKPALNKFAGKTFDDTPFADPFKHPYHDARSRSVIQKKRDLYPEIMPLQIGFKKHGQSGIEVADWLPNIASCVDDLCVVRNMYTTDNDHAAENQIHTGRHKLDSIEPSIGSWVHYGLGSLNDNLPSFCVLGGPTRNNTRTSIDSNYLGPKHAGIPLKIGAASPLPYAKRGAAVLAEEQANQFELARELNGLAAVQYPEDDAIRARIKSYELAFNMQMAVPEALDLKKESVAIRESYGIESGSVTTTAGQRLLTARRLVERGVRFVQVFPSRYGYWDSHQKLKENHGKGCATIDKPVAGLIKDLKQRGLLDETLVVFCTEFGRTPGLETRSGKKDGRDHHPHGFSIFFAGAGVKKGHVYGATDELGFHALEPGHYITDIHATVLHLLGLDSRKLEVPGRKRLDIDHGNVMKGILA
ncbi:MAG: DUF1501 domain-containing protein [Verrucomicrobiales bacterium]|nr:DUF1501 domain-containing protein [Verrucomicrobiales bacterium]